MLVSDEIGRLTTNGTMKGTNRVQTPSVFHMLVPIETFFSINYKQEAT